MLDKLSRSAAGDSAELDFLRRLLAGTTGAADHQALLKEVIDKTREATGTQVCSLYLWRENSRRLVLTATNGLASEGIGIVSMRLGKGVTGWVAEHRGRWPWPIPERSPDSTGSPALTRNGSYRCSQSR
jgi:hypothetical protein